MEVGAWPPGPSLPWLQEVSIGREAPHLPRSHSHVLTFLLSAPGGPWMSGYGTE